MWYSAEKGFRDHVRIEAKHTITRNMKTGFSKNIWNLKDFQTTPPKKELGNK